MQRLHLASAFKAFEREPVALLAHPMDYELRFAPTRFNPGGTFETDEGTTVTHPERSIDRIHPDFGAAVSRTGGTTLTIRVW